jgi:hypothetical protein
MLLQIYIDGEPVHKYDSAKWGELSIIQMAIMDLKTMEKKARAKNKAKGKRRAGWEQYLSK